MNRTLAVILGGGRGTRLYPLTKLRSKPAVPFGGMYRLIDIPVSNCLNSDLYRIFVITQFNSASLNRHVSATYGFDNFREGFINILAAEQTHEHPDWLQGTADAVLQNLRHILPTEADDVLILSGDHIYRMDYRKMVAFHREQRSNITIAALPVSGTDIHRFGVLKLDPSGRVIDFREKPETPDDLKGWELSPGQFNPKSVPSNSPIYLASMGIYIIQSSCLKAVLDPRIGTDFGRDIIPAAIGERRVFAYPFYGYWEDIGTIRSYYEANLMLTDPQPKFELHDPQMRLYTHPRFLPGSQLGDVLLQNSVVCAGCRAEKTKIQHSILGLRSIVKAGCEITDSVIVGADFFESSEELKLNRDRRRPNTGIGKETVIRRAIVDKNARIGEGVRIDPGNDPEDRNGEGYAVRDGIVIIEKNAVIPDGSTIPDRT